MHFYYTGIIVKHKGFIKKDSRVSFPFCLIFIKFNNIYKNSVLYYIIKALHNKRYIPVIKCFKDIISNYLFNKNIQLKNINILYNIIKYLKRFNYLIVWAKVKRWLAANSPILKNMHLKQQKKAAAQVKIAFKLLKTKEINLFLDNKFYFRYQQEGLVLFNKDNAKYIIILSNKEDI